VFLDAAYNDEAGMTAAFNLNLLERINQELEADFEIDQYEHRAFYNSDLGRIEMHLRARQHQLITIEDNSFAISRGETIHTENSYKYTIKEFQAMAGQAGFMPVYVWTDPEEMFSVHYFAVPAC